MPKEIPSPEVGSGEIYDVRTLSASSKIKYLLEIFDSGKGTPEEIEKRKENFTKLLRRYYNHSRDKEKKTKETILGLQTAREKIHNEIMDIISKISLSAGLSQAQRQLTEYLSIDRMHVEEMIVGYFMQNNPVTSNSTDYSIMKEQLSALSSKSGPEEE